ncbi:MAG: porin, partial [Thermodesulfobacteriota bacterium]|nr:porin [Thermodesulfobacteriota bacterium]
MKRFLILALVAAFVLGAGLARAGEVEMQGQFQQNFEWSDNTDFFDYEHTQPNEVSEDDFDARQRIRVYFHYVANENLKGVFGIESTNTWGDDTAATGGALGINPTSLSLKHGYIDFNLPGTAIRVRSGMQYFEPPSSMGSPIFNDDVFG